MDRDGDAPLATERPAPSGAPAVGSRAQLEAVLAALDPGAPRLLALFDLEGLDAFEREHGPQAARVLTERLGCRLVHAVGRGGAAYRVAHGRFALLARVGRGGAGAIVTAGVAALTDGRAEVGVFARPTTARIPLDLAVPATALVELEQSARAQAAQRVHALVGPAVAAHEETAWSPTPIAAGGRAASAAPIHGPAAPRRMPFGLPYLRVATRFRISVLLGVLWMAASGWLAWPWIEELGRSLTLPLAIVLVTGIALIPGYLNVQLATSLALDRPPPLDLSRPAPGLTLLVAAYNEEETIAQTLAYALAQDYPGELHVLVLDDGSTDETPHIAASFASLDERLHLITVPHGGKALALNAGLAAATTPLIATIDADTLLMPGSLRRIVARLQASPPDTAAVAGSVLVRNSRAGMLTAAQTWDYFLGIGSIKRQQALLQATLVAQGAFSVYVAEAVRTAGGWPDCIGEDIVMTWALLDAGARTGFEPTAVVFTEAPSNLKHLVRQRSRWARGMIEGLRAFGVTLLRRHAPYAHSVAANAIFPFLDVAFTFGFLPGIVLAATGNFAIVGPMTLAVLPLNVLLSALMYRRQRASLGQAGLHVRHHLLGFLAYVFLYQALMSPVSVAGYTQELLRTARRW